MNGNGTSLEPVARDRFVRDLITEAVFELDRQAEAQRAREKAEQQSEEERYDRAVGRLGSYLLSTLAPGIVEHLTNSRVQVSNAPGSPARPNVAWLETNLPNAVPFDLMAVAKIDSSDTVPFDTYTYALGIRWSHLRDQVTFHTLALDYMTQRQQVGQWIMQARDRYQEAEQKRREDHISVIIKRLVLRPSSLDMPQFYETPAEMLEAVTLARQEITRLRGSAGDQALWRENLNQAIRVWEKIYAEILEYDKTKQQKKEAEAARQKVRLADRAAYQAAYLAWLRTRSDVWQANETLLMALQDGLNVPYTLWKITYGTSGSADDYTPAGTQEAWALTEDPIGTDRAGHPKWEVLVESDDYDHASGVYPIMIKTRTIWAAISVEPFTFTPQDAPSGAADRWIVLADNLPGEAFRIYWDPRNRGAVQDAAAVVAQIQAIPPEPTPPESILGTDLMYAAIRQAQALHANPNADVQDDPQDEIPF